MEQNKNKHCNLYQFSINQNEIEIGNTLISKLVERVGSTPFYAYDRNRITRKIEELRKHLPKEIKLHYAIKANPMPAVVQHLSKFVDGFDIASHLEMLVALDTAMPNSEISFAGPGKIENELRSAIAAGITINVESKNELHTISKLATELGYPANIALRVNPNFELKNSGMKMGGGPKQFGIDAEEIPAILKMMPNLEVNFEGFHIYSGSQNLKTDALSESQEKTMHLANELAEHSHIPIKKLNIGGGFGIPYFAGETPLDLEIVGINLKSILSKTHKNLANTEIIIELGRFIVGEAGIYICKVIDKKVSRGETFLITDGGLHHHLAASGNFGQVIRKNYPVVLANNVSAKDLETVSVVGPLCTPLDVLGSKVELPAAEIGDYIGILQSGAYGLTASPINFLSQPNAKEILV